MTKTTFQRPLVEFPRGAWDRPGLNNAGARTADEIYIWVGRALTVWENTEFSFAKIYGLLFGNNSAAAERSYGVVTSTKTKKEMLKQAALFFADTRGDSFPTEDFSRLLEYYDQASARRNDIAHGVVMSISLDSETQGYFLVPSSYISKANEARDAKFWKRVSEVSSADPFAVFGQKYRFSNHDIERITTMFQLLSQMATGIFFEQSMQLTQERFDQAPASSKATIKLGKHSDE